MKLIVLTAICVSISLAKVDSGVTSGVVSDRTGAVIPAYA